MSDTPNPGASAPAAPAAGAANPAPKADAPVLSAEDAAFEAEMAPIRAAQKKEKERLEAEARARRGGGDPEPKAEEDGEPGEKEADAKKAEPKLKKFKVNGKEIEIDMADEAKVDRLVQEGLGAGAKFQQASKIKAQAENLVNGLRDPRSIFKILEHPQILGGEKQVRDLCERYLVGHLQKERMSPEEIAAAKEKEELEQLRTESMSAKERAKNEDRERLKEEMRQDFTKKFQDVLDKADLPVNDWTLDRMVKYMRLAIKKGYNNIGPADVVEFVQRDWGKVHGQLYQKKTGEQLVKLLGEDAVRAIREHDVKQFQNGRQNPVAPRATNGQFQKDEPRRTYNSKEEMQEAIRNRR